MNLKNMPPQTMIGILAILALAMIAFLVITDYVPTDQLTDNDVRPAMKSLIDYPDPYYQRITYRKEIDAVDYWVLHPYLGWTTTHCRSTILDGVECTIDSAAWRRVDGVRFQQNWADFVNRVPPPSRQ